MSQIASVGFERPPNSKEKYLKILDSAAFTMGQLEKSNMIDDVVTPIQATGKCHVVPQGKWHCRLLMDVHRHTHTGATNNICKTKTNKCPMDIIK